MPRLSLIIPVLNEAERLGDSLARLFDQPWVQECEIIVVDGGSDDSSREVAARFPCLLQDSPAGRAVQMNAGARRARGALLLFLHADSRLPDAFEPACLETGEWGFFRVRLSGKGLAFRIIETAINLRTRITAVAGGDQGLFFSRDLFAALGGFPPIPLMEDIAISKLARRRCSPRILATPIVTSSRRWRQRGILRTVLLMWWMRFAFWVGVDPARLHRIYYSGR